MPGTLLLDDTPIPPQLDRAAVPSQLFQVPPTPSASSALYRSIYQRKRSHHSGPPAYSGNVRDPSTEYDYHRDNDDESERRILGEGDYRPSRYRNPPRRSASLDDSVDSLPDVGRKRSRLDPSSSSAAIVAASPSEKVIYPSPVESPISGSWGRTMMDVVGKVWDFCWTGAFRGFYAGGGPGYSMATGERAAAGHEAVDASYNYQAMATEKHHFESTTIPGEYPSEHRRYSSGWGHDDDGSLHGNWVLVSPEAEDPSPSIRRRTAAGSDRPIAHLTHHYHASGHHSRRRHPQSGKRTLLSQPAGKLPFSSPAKPRESPVSVETQRYMARRRRMEREEDASLRRLNEQLQAMIREGKQALGTRVEVEMEDGYDMED